MPSHFERIQEICRNNEANYGDILYYLSQNTQYSRDRKMPLLNQIALLDLIFVPIEEGRQQRQDECKVISCILDLQNHNTEEKWIMNLNIIQQVYRRLYKISNQLGRSHIAKDLIAAMTVKFSDISWMSDSFIIRLIYIVLENIFFYSPILTEQYIAMYQFFSRIVRV